jgi:hypothetical protein
MGQRTYSRNICRVEYGFDRKAGWNMATARYRAAMLDAETGANESYRFEAESGLFQLPVDEIIQVFIEYLNTHEYVARPVGYELNSAMKKNQKRVVMATGSLLVDKGEIPFLLMISPDPRPDAV